MGPDLIGQFGYIWIAVLAPLEDPMQLKRREILRMIGGAATCWAVSAAAQQPKMPIVGVLLVESPGSEQFRQQLREELRKLGYVDGQSIRFEFRSDQGKPARLPELAAELESSEKRKPMS